MRKFGFILFTALLLIGCNEDVENPARLEISLFMPKENFQSPYQRAMGDPGITEHFELPQYAYIFITKESGVNSIVWEYMKINLEASEWTATRYNGALSSPGDSIYHYSQPIQIMLQNEQPKGNVYAICSNIDLNFDTDPTTLTTQDQVLNLKINVADDPADDTDGNIQQNLQNIFTTPYNYTIGSPERYYCSYDCTSGHSANVNLLLYHIAAKVDLKWNVADSVRIKPNPADAVRLTYLGAQNLFNGWAYAFKPMENILPEMPASGYNRPNLVNNDEGLWWEGRTYFYTIPFTVSGNSGFFPLQLLMRTNGSSGTGYFLILNQPVTTTSPFVPWIRGNIKLTQPLTDGTYVKTGE